MWKYCRKGRLRSKCPCEFIKKNGMRAITWSEILATQAFKKASFELSHYRILPTDSLLACVSCSDSGEWRKIKSGGKKAKEESEGNRSSALSTPTPLLCFRSLFFVISTLSERLEQANA